MRGSNTFIGVATTELGSDMPTAQRYLLDTTGFVHFKGLHPRDTIGDAASQIVTLLDREHRGVPPRKFSFVEDNPELFLSLIAVPQLLTLLAEVLGPYFRLDHAFCLQQPWAGGDGVNLHGGPGSGLGLHMFVNQAGAIYCGQISVGIPLQDSGGFRGGLTYLPGSHRGEFPLQGGEVLPLLKQAGLTERLLTPELNMGDVAVFPETLVHGATAVSGPRRSLYFMFTAGHVCYRGVPFLPEVQAAAVQCGLPNLLQPAFVSDYPAWNDSPAVRRQPTVIPK